MVPFRPPTLKRLGLGSRAVCLYLLSVAALLALGMAYLHHLSILESALQSAPNASVMSLETLRETRFDVLLFLGLAGAMISYVAFVHHRATTAQLDRLGALARSVADGVPAPDLSGFSADAVMTLADELRRIKRGTARRMDNIAAATDEVFNAAMELAEAARQGMQSSLAQSEAVSRIAVSIEELSTSVNAAAADAEGTNDMSAQSHSLSVKGDQVVAAMVREIRNIEEAVAQAVDANALLTERSNAIGTFVEVIDGISDQTNLLALNAAIEAARAGEHGRGFAVVSDEVRTLSNRARESTREIGTLVEGIRNEVQALMASMENVRRYVGTGAQMADDAGGALRQITDQAGNTRDMIQRISEALVEQGHASEDIAANVEQISLMTQEHKSAIEQTAATADYLLALSKQLQAVCETRQAPAAG